MAITLDLATLFVAKTAAQILDASLEFATFLGLPVTSWRTGDPTKTQFEAQAEHLAILDQNLAEYVKGGYLDTAEGVWLTIYAEQAYGVTRGAASVASAELTLTNSGAGVYSWDANDLTFTNPTTGKTYKNTEAVSLSGVGATATFAFAAEEAGSASTTGADTLELLTSVLGVTVTSNEAAIGIDEQSDSELRTACRESLAALSPNGPADAYRFVATNSELTGASTANKVAVYADDPTGLVTVYVSNYADQVSAPDLVLVEDALRLLCLPLAVSLDVVNATQIDQNVTVSLFVWPSSLTNDAIRDAAELAVETLFVATPIGGRVHTSSIVGAIFAAVEDVAGAGTFYSALCAVPSSAVDLDIDENLRLATVNVIVTVFSE
jgi:phage-related baseplate assembly protein